MSRTFDVFICHASEVKPTVAQPLADALEGAGFSTWLDDWHIQWGDSINTNLAEGISSSKYVVVILSVSILRKNWAMSELNAALASEMETGDKRVLPLFVGDRTEILKNLPFLKDRQGLTWTGDSQPIVDELLALLGKEPKSGKTMSASPSFPSIPLPITDYDRDKFLKEAFNTIASYFEAGSRQIEASENGLNAEFDRQSAIRFSTSVYVRGKKQCECRIWLGDELGTRGIYYSEGVQTFASGNAFNEWLSLDDTSNGLALKSSISGFSESRIADATPEEAAELLWRRFIQPLQR